MAIITRSSQVDVALYLMEKIDSVYLGLGRTSAWDDEDNPPVPDRETEHLDELIGLKKINRMFLCKLATGGGDSGFDTIEYMGETWELIPNSLAHEEGATHVFFEARIEGSELPVGKYRQVGIYTGVTPEEGVSPNKATLLPEEVQDFGILEFYDNRQLQNRTADTTILERFIVSTE